MSPDKPTYRDFVARLVWRYRRQRARAQLRAAEVDYRRRPTRARATVVGLAAEAVRRVELNPPAS